MDNYGKKGDADFVYATTSENVRRILEQVASTSEKAPKLDTFKESADFVTRYVDSKASSNKQDITENLKKNFPLTHNKPAKADRKKPPKKKSLTSIERRRLGLHRLPKTGLSYKSFANLHQLWVEHMEAYLELKLSTSSSNQDLLNTRLAKADYHGCLLLVNRSTNPVLVGIKGIVVMETKNTFQMVCQDDQLKIVPKRGSIFTFCIDRWTFTLFGNQFDIRPSERAARKFKSRNTIDL